MPPEVMGRKEINSGKDAIHFKICPAWFKNTQPLTEPKVGASFAVFLGSHIVYIDSQRATDVSQFTTIKEIWIFGWQTTVDI
jgi:hypothetical protein